MKFLQKSLTVILTICLVMGLCPTIIFAESGAETQTVVSISSDNTFSYVDSDKSNTVNTGDILYVGTEGLYIWSTPGDIDSATDTVGTVTVKKVNTSTYLQDDNARVFYATYYEEGFNTIMGHTDSYVNKLSTTYGYTFESTRFSGMNMNDVKNTAWAYEFNWWSAYRNNSGKYYSSAMVKTDTSYNEDVSGYAYCRPGVKAMVSYIKTARNAMYDATITCDNGHVEIQAVANKVTINPVADSGYILDTLSITDEDGTFITVTDNQFTMPAKNINIKATFKKCTVSFNSNGGSAIETQTVDAGGVATIPTTPTKTGYIFAGWYGDENYTTQYDFSVPVTSDLQLYAKWEVCNHENSDVKASCKSTVTCSLCGGEIAALEHDYSNIKHNETEHWYECSVCNAPKPDSKEVHEFEWVIDVNPTEDSNGLKHEACVCGETRNENTVILATNTDKSDEEDSTEDDKAETDGEDSTKDDKAEADGEDSTEENVENSPATGDTSSLTLYFMLLFLSCGGYITLMFYKKSLYDK